MKKTEMLQILLPLQVVGSERVSLSVNGRVLTIAEVILSDSGVYTCNTSNNYGTAEADYDILLMIYCKSLAGTREFWLLLMTNRLPCMG